MAHRPPADREREERRLAFAKNDIAALQITLRVRQEMAHGHGKRGVDLGRHDVRVRVTGTLYLIPRLSPLRLLRLRSRLLFAEHAAEPPLELFDELGRAARPAGTLA